MIVPIKEITNKVLKHGFISIYLEEGNRAVLLPFKYYQSKRVIYITTNFNLGELCITLSGSFVINVSSEFKFRVIIVASKSFAKEKGIIWEDYYQSKRILGF